MNCYRKAKKSDTHKKKLNLLLSRIFLMIFVVAAISFTACSIEPIRVSFDSGESDTSVTVPDYQYDPNPENSVTLEWDPNTEPDIAGYILYYGFETGNYEYSIDVGDQTTVTVEDLEPGVTYYFAATAYNSEGYESDFSEEITYTESL